ncbi:MAG: RsmE family RNA methyltransferase [Verrucomicrobiota bacterium]|nr:RsmE family RNA methyltransferase [Verrucomicrobiota bacterium]
MMHRFYLPPDQVAQPELTLADRESHHAINVLRLREGERVAVLDGAGNECLCELVVADKKAVRLAVKQRNAHEPLPYRITLLQAMTKAKSMDFIVQKATELCAHRIVPLSAERSVAQVDPGDAGAKVDKWRNIAIDSIKQCGCPWLPEIEEPVTPRKYMARSEAADLPLIASLQGGTRHPREHVEGFIAVSGRPPVTISIWIGPEGDFTPAESDGILSSGALPITLGKVVLRSETAAVYCLAVLNYELQAPLKGSA